ncbi:Nucleotide-binding protein, UspA family [Halanaeroarchaeum sp. HSR-CO]|uniref:universal stress protein n=1 Tax=Halanaeroarchaeum sp. HSR-CO TaxID=2866382 RepID=UPI00217D331E|nr:universal stress protein [Halanaeroarchaeum sp. HSR-CO]UWG48630.1 Nucleotide-binding protein, UspA family [Halanaeroarchaeum sp. HSR-CO]
MAESLLSRVVVPVAGPDDAAATCEVAVPHVAAAGGSLTAVYVVEKAGGAIDKASVEQREEFAEEAFEAVRSACNGADVDCSTEIVFGTDVVDAILDFGRDTDASAIVFSPRRGSRWLDLLSGNLSAKLVKQADRPVIVFPSDGEEE